MVGAQKTCLGIDGLVLGVRMFEECRKGGAMGDILLLTDPKRSWKLCETLFRLLLWWWSSTNSGGRLLLFPVLLLTVTSSSSPLDTLTELDETVVVVRLMSSILRPLNRIIFSDSDVIHTSHHTTTRCLY